MNTSNINLIKGTFEKYLDKFVSLEGRLHNLRILKNIVFLDLAYHGDTVQCSLTREQAFDLSAGDFIRVNGTAYYTKSGEPTIKIAELKIINKWLSEIGYKEISTVRESPLKSFDLNAYKKTYFPFVLRKSIRKYFDGLGFVEAQTPILGSNYNGGRSYPVLSLYNGHKLGFNRTTFEDRMQALIGSGFEKIYQIGSVFRSEFENTFLEGYSVKTDWNSGIGMIKGMLSRNVQDLVEAGIGPLTPKAEKVSEIDWIELDLFDEVEKYFGISPTLFANDIEQTKKILLKNEVIGNKDISVESIADGTANYIAQKQIGPVIINGFPSWSSPLYKEKAEGRLYRCRLYLPPSRGGFELGIQENDYLKFLKRVTAQKSRWKLDEEDDRIVDSDLVKIISGGLPEIFGFGLSPDRILKIWGNDFKIDPYL